MENLSNEILSDIIVHMKYAKYKPELKRRETWAELVERNKQMHIKKYPQIAEEITNVYNDYVLPKLVLPSMRSMQFAGTPIELNQSRVYNCAFLHIDHPDAFSETMFLLLGGTGVGYSVQKRHVSDLPLVQGPKQRTRKFIIGDSIEGWSDAVKVLVEAYFHNKSRPSFVYDDIRPKGARLVTSGGKAPGPQPLKDCIYELTKVLDGAVGRQLTSLEVHDMVCYIADAVLAGGIRRAALISLFDKDDQEMLTCKSGNWWETHPHRGRANNSAVFVRGQVIESEFWEVWRAVEASGAGEPGIFWTNDPDIGTNPCCVSGDTMVLTSEGRFRADELVGKKFKAVIEGNEYDSISNGFWKTGVKQVYEVVLKSGHKVKTTSDHRFLTPSGWRQLKDLELGDFVKINKGSDIETGKESPDFMQITSVTPLGEEDVYDVTIDTVECFDGNGIVLHNCEISLNPMQFCVAGDTKLITKTGIVNIKDVVGANVEIWNGKKWSMVEPYKTGDADRLHRVHFSDGSYLDATDNHKFLVKNRFQSEFREVETLELIDLLQNSKYSLQVPRSDIKYTDGVNAPHAYEYGFVLGDGYVDGSGVYAGLYNEDKKIDFPSGKKHERQYTNWNGSLYEKIHFNELNLDFTKELKYSNGLPSEIFSWDRDSILQFVAGWADADGCQASKGIRIYGRKDKIEMGQLLLTKCGIDSSLNLMAKKGDATNLGIRLNDVWYLQITQTIDIPCKRLACTNKEKAKYKGKYQNIRKIETLDGLHESFCLTEDELHQCVFNNVLTKQCNLSEVNASNVVDQEDLNNRVRAAAFIGTLQAGYTDFHYLREVWRRQTEKEALIGVSMTGIASGAVSDLSLEEAAKVVKEENARVAKLIGINKAARTCAVKPAGSTSLVFGSSSGIHAWHNDYYIRRVRVGKNEAIYQYMIKKCPSLVVPDLEKPHLQAIFEFPQKAPEGSALRTEDVMDYLGRIKRFNLEWVKEGHRVGNNRHNVSATINIKNGEWEKVGKWMWENQDAYTGLSAFPYFGGTYAQAPFEDIDKERYEEMYSHLTKIDLSEVDEDEDVTTLQSELACAGGYCEIT